MNKQKCLSCGKEVDLDAGTYWSAPCIDIEDGEPIFCSETCIANYYDLRWVKKAGVKKTAKQRVPADTHICKYCGDIAEGTFEDLLCAECRQTFGHSLYSEL